MIRRFLPLLLLLLPLALAACSSGSSGAAPEDPDGPGQAPHPVDTSYLEGANHGPDAKADLRVCQACHGQSGGPGSNPRFNLGIDSLNGTGCEACHGINYAHPADWAGPNETYHYSAGNIQNSCTLCHGASLDGIDGVGDSCLGCHDSTTSFTLDCTFCHGDPPDGMPDVSTDTGVDHGSVADVPQHDTCVLCHGMKESDTGGSFTVAAEYLLFDKASNTIGDHWDGFLNMNSSTGYDQADSGCNAACHANDLEHQLSDSGLPVKLKNFDSGVSAPHPVGSSFLFPAGHGPAAKGLTAAFPGGMADCQLCHADPEIGANPRFNIGIIRGGSIGCETCHNDLTAHPSVGPRDNSHWYDGTYRHGDIAATRVMTMCTLCHGADLDGPADGGVGPACTACHASDPVANPSGCISCHNLPPNGNAPAGNIRPNRQGLHHFPGHSSRISNDPTQTCARCHNGAGIGTKAHFDSSSPADVAIRPINDPEDTISAVSTNDNTTCTGECHYDDKESYHGHGDIEGQTWYPAP